MTSYEVAALAGVAQPTVSRALRGNGVAEPTRSRVVAAAAALGYVPSDRGRALATSQSNRIGIVVDDLQNAFYRSVIGDFERVTALHGKQIMPFRDTNDDEALISQLLAGSIDGVAMASARLDSKLPAILQARGLPVVLINRLASTPAVDSSVSDNLAGARIVAERLMTLGHRRIGAIFGPSYSSNGRDRARGFQEALAEQGIALPPSAVREVAYSHDEGYRALNDILDADAPPTGIFCGNDMIAIGALNAAKRRGMDVPRQLSIIGYDDMDASSWELVDLTTVRQGATEMNEAAARMLIARIENPDRLVEHVVIPPVLVVRGTDGPPFAS
ncbi:LacI family DNA-binding transcriptional regulator [Pseudarthrobacter oxydans]|uniref:LacI family DNA-binding transcriptional regulator n=1 Tax=Pseudarthrobacter oxydans TaxID=1671 RepID=UPI00381FF556